MYSCNSRMRRPTGLMGVYLPSDSTTAKQIPSPGVKTSLSVRTPPPSLRLACSRVYAPFQNKKQKTTKKTGLKVFCVRPFGVFRRSPSLGSCEKCVAAVRASMFRFKTPTNCGLCSQITTHAKVGWGAFVFTFTPQSAPHIYPYISWNETDGTVRFID